MKNPNEPTTAIGEQIIAQSDMTRDDFAIAARILEYKKSGGSLERLISIARDVYARFPGAAVLDLPSGRHFPAASGKPIGDGEGQAVYAPEDAVQSVPSSSPSQSERGGHRTGDAMASTAKMPPAREPSDRQRAISAANANTAAKKVMDVRKTSDGRSWGDIGAHELTGMMRDGTIAKAVERRLGQLSEKQRFMKLRELMSDAEFQAAIIEAERSNEF